MLEDLVKSKIIENIENTLTCIDFNLFSFVYDGVIVEHKNQLSIYPDYTTLTEFFNDKESDMTDDELIAKIINSNVSFDYELFIPHIMPDKLGIIDKEKYNQFLNRDYLEYVLNEYISNYVKSDRFKDKLKEVIFVAGDIVVLQGIYKKNRAEITIGEFRSSLDSALPLNPYRLLTESILESTSGIFDSKKIFELEYSKIIESTNKILLKKLDNLCDDNEYMFKMLHYILINRSSEAKFVEIIRTFIPIIMGYQVYKKLCSLNG